MRKDAVSPIYCFDRHKLLQCLNCMAMMFANPTTRVYRNEIAEFLREFERFDASTGLVVLSACSCCGDGASASPLANIASPLGRL